MLLFYTGFWTELWCEKSTEIYYNATAENWKNSYQQTLKKLALAESGRLHLPLPKYEAKPFCYLIFFFPPSPPLVKMRIILIWYFFTFCLLEISCDREGVLFANHFHLLFIIFCIMLLIQKYYYLRIIIICTAFAFEYHNRLEIIRI